MKEDELIVEAQKSLGEFRLSEDFLSAGSVAADLETKNGNIYTGICLDLSCGIGFCAEHSAIAEMLKKRETQIETIVAVNKNGVIPPCGRCRELIFQIDKNNLKTRVLLAKDKCVFLEDLLPDRWI
ncbi:cytidine deaminase [candidate division WOR-3 bacterium]|nr:cytidine deaminase [candidate division WOR-3 bacterium]